ncbi:hypothetical protein E1B28_010377 [Marasmius oreades]|uniref:Glycoside hydrolase family 16 protein n=1 Tax=Marasmius oreades TaxID=181124 RepID=A0A9P7RYG5_9AGAR|nr:uncharacterized protein E1B28_010377 [Marasmius oreades]KAG7091333.1 hypothetical protein E1B28_010377 [Marasmius oreades]
MHGAAFPFVSVMSRIPSLLIVRRSLFVLSHHRPSSRMARISISLFLYFPLVFATNYNLIRDYSGSTFFNGWRFTGDADRTTNGDAFFVTEEVGLQQHLAYVDPNTNRAIIKVDNVSVVADQQKRNTVKITTQDLYPVGSVWITDLHHVPFGCSVWPAWWSQAPGWPMGGEIDTFEGVNLFTQNQMSLHTLPGCKQVNPVQTSTLIPNADCSNTTNNNQGCIVKDPNTNSYGQPFADAGGGVFVTEMATSGISIWFFTRSAVPSSITSNSSTIDTSTLGKPVANYPATGCPMDTFFGPQALIFDITLCGDFARPLYEQPDSGCPGSCYKNAVLGPPSGYDNAYFDIAYLRVYSSNPSQGGGASGNGGNTNSTTGDQGGKNDAQVLHRATLTSAFASVIFLWGIALI